MVFQKGNDFWKLRKSNIPWNKGKSQPKSPELIAKMKIIFAGENNPFYGRHHSAKQKAKWRISRKGYSPSLETREKISQNTSGSGNPNYIDGRSYKPYPPEFKKIRRSKVILKRDGFICQLCKDYIPIFEGRHKNFLTIHHIDYNKKNNFLSNLVTLCNFCNVSVNTNRQGWKKFFEARKE